MRGVVRIVLLAVVSTAAWADWEKVASAINSTGYVDTTSIDKQGNTVAMWVLIDYQKPPFDGNNLPYLSLTMRNQYHCQQRQFRVLTIISHTGNMGRGERPYKTDEPSAWEAVPAKSIQKRFWEIACLKPRPDRP